MYIPLMDDEQDEDRIQAGEDQERPREMQENESVGLIHQKERDETYGDRIGPEFVFPESDDQENFHETVEQKIECTENFRTVRKLDDILDDGIGDSVIGILVEFMLGEKRDDIV